MVHSDEFRSMAIQKCISLMHDHFLDEANDNIFQLVSDHFQGPTISVCKRTVRQWYNEYVYNGKSVADRSRKRQQQLTVRDDDLLICKQLMSIDCTLFPKELAQMIYEINGMAYTKDQLKHAIVASDWTTKKIETVPLERNEAWRSAYIATVIGNIDTIPSSSYVFIDEMHLKDDECVRPNGRGHVGIPAMKPCFFGHGGGQG